MEQFLDKVKGTIYGQAIGDALGLGTEGMTDEDMAWKYPNGITHYSDIFQDRHRKRWKIGDWTDDTDMMLCIAKAIIKDKRVYYTSVARNFKEWANGEPMGIGENTYKVLSFADYVDKPFEASKMIWEMSHRKSAANGGLMRTSIVGLLPNNVEEWSANICRLTHYDPRCVGSCVIVSKLIHSLVYDESPISYDRMIEIGTKYDERIKEYIDLAINSDHIKELDLQNWDSVGYTLKTLAAGLWAYWHSKAFEECLLAVVRAGGDADTNAAVACAILGAKFGFHAIPPEYVDGLLYREKLDEVVEGMMEIRNKANLPKSICIDFDGVIHDYSRGWLGIDVFDKVLPGASEATHRLHDAGYMIIIYTTRNDTPALRDFLNKNEICFDYINENPYQPNGSEYGKVKADMYLDDRGICFTGNWNDAIDKIFNFKTWQQDYWK